MISFEQLRDHLMANRSYRRFDHSRPISPDILSALVELTRSCPSGRNLQPLRYRIVWKDEECDAIFPALTWAGYYTDWDGPSPEERPVAYLVQCLDADLAADCLCDDGLQLEAITLGAATRDIHGVIIKAFNPDMIAKALNLPPRYKPRYVLALGYPAETVIIEDTDGSTSADIRYHHDDLGRHVVPKRPLSELIIS